MNVALDKTIHEFKMWGSMSRKPGQPSEYLREIYKKTLDEQRLAPAPDRYPEIPTEKVWEGILKKLFQKDYKFDAGFFGSLNEYAKKVAYFFHASLQGTGAYPNAAAALTRAAGGTPGAARRRPVLHAGAAGAGWRRRTKPSAWTRSMPPANRCSRTSTGPEAVGPAVPGGRRGDGRQGIEPHEVLHVGCSLPRDVGPAKKWGMRTALFAGDRASLAATAEQLKDPQSARTSC